MPENLNVKGAVVTLEETIKLLRIHPEYKINFGKHISEICRKAASQFNVLKRLKISVAFDEKKIIIMCFIYSNFDYFPLVWYFSSASSLQKIEAIQERALRFLYNDQLSSYYDLHNRVALEQQNL